MDFQSIEMVKWLFFHSPQSQAHIIYMQGLFPCPASPTRPPDVQISPGPASASLQRRAT